MTDDFEMLFPFVVVESAGGPFDDAAYVAGCEMGQLMAQLRVAKSVGLDPPSCTLHTENVPQADRVAMAYGATMRVEPWGDDIDPQTASEWAHCIFDWDRSDLVPGEEG